MTGNVLALHDRTKTYFNGPWWSLMTNSASDGTNPKDDAAPLPSLDDLVDQHYDYLYRYAYRYLRSDDGAEEVVQETFLAAVQSIKKFEGRCSPQTWLISIMRHKIMDRVRARSKAEVVSYDALASDPMSKLFDQVDHWRTETGPLLWGAPAEDTLRQKEFFVKLDECLSKLPHQFRQIFLLREMEELDRSEICTQSGLTSSNVGVILHRARLLLQACLQRNWFQEKLAR